MLSPTRHAEIADSTPAAIRLMSRALLIEWLCTNDSSGVYTDGASQREGYQPLEQYEAADLVISQCEG